MARCDDYRSYPHLSHIVDQEEASCRNLQCVCADGAERVASGSKLVPNSPTKASERDPLWEVCKVFRGRERASPSTTAFKTAAAAIDACEIRDRSNSGGGGGASNQINMEEILSEVGRVLTGVGSMEDSREGSAGRPCRDMGTTQLGEEHRGVPSVEGATGQELSLLVRACPGCSSTLVYNEGASLYPLCCDGTQHVGPTSIRNSNRFSCTRCGRYNTLLSFVVMGVHVGKCRLTTY